MTINVSVVALLSASAWFLTAGCSENRYEFTKNEQGQTVRLDKHTGDMVIVSSTVDPGTAPSQVVPPGAPPNMQTHDSLQAKMKDQARAREVALEKFTNIEALIYDKQPKQLMLDHAQLRVDVDMAQRWVDQHRSEFGSDAFTEAVDDALHAAGKIVEALDRGSDATARVLAGDESASLTIVQEWKEVSPLFNSLTTAHESATLQHAAASALPNSRK